MSKVTISPELLEKFKTSFMKALLDHEDGAFALKNGHKLSFDIINEDIIFIQDNLTDSELAIQAVQDVDIPPSSWSRTWVEGQIGFFIEDTDGDDDMYLGSTDEGFASMAGYFVDAVVQGGYWLSPDEDEEFYIESSVKKFKDTQGFHNNENIEPETVPCVACYLIVGIALSFIALAIF